MSDNFVVLTGGPGAGKSTLIDALAAAGFATSPEAGRAIVRDHVAIGGPALPWADTTLFAELILGWELRSHHAAAGRPGPVFFDRGVPDVAGYYRLLGRTVPAHVQRAAERFRYHSTVFLAPPWPEIYTGDTERRQSLREAERTYECMLGAYTDLGYHPVPLPRVDVAARVRFVLATLSDCGHVVAARDGLRGSLSHFGRQFGDTLES